MPLQLSTAIEGSGPVVDSVAVGTSSGQRQIVALGSLASTEAGSTAVTIGSVALLAGSTGNTICNVTVSNSVAVTSGVVLGAGSSGNVLGSVAIYGQPDINSILELVQVIGTTSGPIGVVYPGSTWPIAIVSAGSSVTVGIVAGSTLDVILRGGTTGYTVGSAALLAGSSANTIGAVALVAGSTATTVGTVGLTSTANEVQLTVNSTAYVNSNSIVSTGGAIGATEAMMSLRRVTNFSSGSSGTTFATSAIPYRLGPLTVSVYNTTNAFKTISLVLRGSTTSTGTSTNGSPLWNATFAPNAPSTLGQTNVGDTYSFPVSILAPTSMSFGFSAVASSSGNNLALCLCAEEVR